MEEEVSGREFQGYEAGRLDVSCDLLDEFGGEGGEVGGIGLADFLISPVRHGGICLFVRLLVMVMAMTDELVLLTRRCSSRIWRRSSCGQEKWYGFRL